MIEISLYFALGFLIATLMALLLMPAVWRRAVRLTRRQIEATTPLTRAEILADRDQIAAEYAVSIRRYEMGIGALRRRVADQMVTVTRQGDQIRDLATERDAVRVELERLNERLAAYAARDKGTDITLDKIEALAAENQRLIDERNRAAAELRRLEERARSVGRDRDAATDELQRVMYRLSEAEADANARTEQVQRQLDQRTIELTEAERIAAEAKAARVEAAARLASGATEIASLRAEREALTLKLAALQTGTRLAINVAPGDNVTTTIEDLERQRGDLDRRLGEITAERDALRGRLAELEVRLATPPSETDPEFAALRRALTDLGERFAAAETAAAAAEFSAPPSAPETILETIQETAQEAPQEAAPTETAVVPKPTAQTPEPAPQGAPVSPSPASFEPIILTEAGPDADERATDDDTTSLPPAGFPFAPPGAPFSPTAEMAQGGGQDGEESEPETGPTAARRGRNTRSRARGRARPN